MDLYRANATLANPELVAPNVGDAEAQPAVTELPDGRLVLFDQDYRVAIWDQGETDDGRRLGGAGREFATRLPTTPWRPMATALWFWGKMSRPP